jgi:hypothetical protein
MVLSKVLKVDFQNISFLGVFEIIFSKLCYICIPLNMLGCRDKQMSWQMSTPCPSKCAPDFLVSCLFNKK